MADEPRASETDAVEDGEHIRDVRLDGDGSFDRRRGKAALLITDRVEDRRKLVGEAFRVIAETRPAMEDKRGRARAFANADERAGRCVDLDLAHRTSVPIAAESCMPRCANLD